jgi:micrococcal nuclease
MRRRTYRWTPFLAAFALFATLLFKQAAPVDYNNVLAARVIDGDTIGLVSGKSVRYIGIDTPETRRNTPSGWREVQEPFGKEAKAFNEKMVLGKRVRLEFDVQAKDKYQRLLAYCFVNIGGKEIFVEEELLKNGLAYLYTFPPNIKYVDRLVVALEEAKSKKVGIWSQDLEIDSKEAYRFLGERKMIQGNVLRTRATAKVTTLELPGANVVIFQKDLGLFEKENISPKEFYRAKTVRVFGLVKEYHGKPEIIVSHPEAIEVK